MNKANQMNAQVLYGGMVKHNKGPRKRIKLVEEDRTFDCVKDAAEYVNGQASCLIRAVKENKKYKGKTFVYETMTHEQIMEAAELRFLEINKKCKERFERKPYGGKYA